MSVCTLLALLFVCFDTELNVQCNVAGVKCDEEEAMSLYRRSAELGNESAKFRLQEVEARQAVSQWSGRSIAVSESMQSSMVIHM